MLKKSEVGFPCILKSGQVLPSITSCISVTSVHREGFLSPRIRDSSLGVGGWHEIQPNPGPDTLLLFISKQDSSSRKTIRLFSLYVTAQGVVIIIVQSIRG